MPLGDWATWVQSAATVGALIAAVVAARVAQRVYRIESERDERAADERRERFDAGRRAQADKVAAWYAWLPQSHTGDPRHPTFLQSYGWTAFIRNASDLPIYDVDVDFYYVMPNAGAGNVPSRRGGGEHHQVVAPQEEVYSFAAEAMLKQTDAEGRRNYAVALEFRDAAGIRWRRGIDGKLTELSIGVSV